MGKASMLPGKPGANLHWNEELESYLGGNRCGVTRMREQKFASGEMAGDKIQFRVFKRSSDRGEASVIITRLVRDFYAIQCHGPVSDLEAEPGGRRKSEIQSPPLRYASSISSSVLETTPPSVTHLAA